MYLASLIFDFMDYLVMLFYISVSIYALLKCVYIFSLLYCIYYSFIICNLLCVFFGSISLFLSFCII